MKLRRILYLGGAFVLILVKFAIDVIGKNVELELGGLSLVRELAVIGAFALLYVVIDVTASKQESTPLKKLGFVFIATVFMIIAGAILDAVGVEGFDAKNLMLVPLSYPTVFIGSLLAVAFGFFGVIVFRLLRDLVLVNRKPAARRNYWVFAGLTLATAISAIMVRPLDSGVVTRVLFILAIIFALVNSFRLPWIVHLTKREKMFSLAFGFFLFIGFVILDVMLARNSFLSRALLYYSHPLHEFVTLVSIFATLYAGMAFVSTLFHMPTAEAFDRKRSEVSSLHTLSKLVTQVFDFEELVDTVTSMTMQVVEASRCWVEIVHVPGDSRVVGAVELSSGYRVKAAGMKNITQEEIDRLVDPRGRSVRDTVIAERKTIVLDELGRDPRFGHVENIKDLAGSLVVVPLVSHTGLAGILYAAKKQSFGFEKDDIDVIAAFADQATVAIENSRLIRESIERERLFREMLVAQEMQKKLLPQSIPSMPSLEIDAVSTPAFEVGGDYYDFMEFGDGRIGIVVGDVSGKGVSAAFYMSEMKGIFQALARMYESPKELLARANEALSCSIDKHSFVSLIYVIIDTHSGRLTMARAGHCPMLHISAEQGVYVRPSGLGLGLATGAVFEGAIDEEVLHLQPDDVCVLYTDGVTEARNGDDEFGYDRLMMTAQAKREMGPIRIKEHILQSVSAFTEQRAHDDDVTLVVMKWKGSDRRGERAK